MRWLALLLLAACEPAVCLEPCQGQSASVSRAGGVVCYCGTAYAVAFPWTMGDAACAADRQWWASHAPFPCPQPGGGTRKARP